MEKNVLYKIDEVSKAILIGLKKHGRQKSFSQILNEAEVQFDNATQLNAATTLEALDLIQSVSYQLPLKIRAELSSVGETVVASLMKPKKSRIRTGMHHKYSNYLRDSISV